jgi:hypothetical protein
MKEVSRFKIKLKRSEVGQSNQNYAAEREIGELKKRWRNRMLKGKVLPRLRDYGLVYETNILNRIPCGQHQCTGIEIVTGENQTYPSELTLILRLSMVLRPEKDRDRWQRALPCVMAQYCTPSWE